MACGTTAANYMATIHREATEALCDIAEERGQRALVGKVSMNRNGFGDYVETTADSLNETRIYLSGAIAKKFRLVEPTVVPRFAVSCDKALMVGLGELAQQYGARVHTHLAETKPEARILIFLVGSRGIQRRFLPLNPKGSPLVSLWSSYLSS